MKDNEVRKIDSILELSAGSKHNKSHRIIAESKEGASFVTVEFKESARKSHNEGMIVPAFHERALSRKHLISQKKIRNVPPQAAQ